MTLQERLVALAPYNAGFNIYDNQFVINITYVDNWVVVEPDKDSDIMLTKDLANENLYYYIAPMSVSFDTIFDLVDMTINYNIELQEKVVFFKEKVNELKTLFANEDLESLRTLEFKLKKKKQTPPKKTVKKKAEKVEKKEVKEVEKDVVIVPNNKEIKETKNVVV